MKRIVAYIFLILISLSAAAQQPIAGSSMTLKERYNELMSAEQEVSERLNEARTLFSSDASVNSNLGATIVDFEKRLFSIREELSKVSTEIAATGTILTPEVKDEPIAVSEQKTLLVENDYFRNALDASDYKQLLNAQNFEGNTIKLLDSLKAGYRTMSLVLTAYQLSAKGHQADSIFTRLKDIEAHNNALDNKIGTEWSTIFDTKIYAYNYIFDKKEERELLEEQEKQMNNLYMLENEIAGEYMYPNAAKYALQKILLVGYEKRLADKAGLTAAADSLSRLTLPSSHIQDYFLPALDTNEQMFYDFADISFTRPVKYTSAWQIPEVEIFPRGTMYRILLGVYSKPPVIATFKGTYPMSHETKADGKHYYYAGGFATFEEADAALAKLKKQGFTNPRIVVWNETIYEEITSAPAANKKPGKTPEVRTRYRIEIRGVQDNISQKVRDIITSQATGKEISRMVDPQTGETIFVIGSFANKDLADSLVQSLSAVDGTITLKVVTIK